MTENRSPSNDAAPGADSVAQYLREIGRHRLLTPVEEVKLAKRIEQGDVAARDRMVESNLRLVVVAARSHGHRGVPVLDLIQEGTLGLIRAAERFDWRRGTRFSTYAMWWIRQAIGRAVCNQAEPIRLPIHIRERRRRLARAEQAIQSERCPKPSVDELARACNLSPENAERALGARYTFTSLEASGEAGGDVADPRAGDAYEHVERRLTCSRLEQLLSLLRPTEQCVIELRFGICGDECSTERTAQLLEISPGAVRMLERRAISRLRELASPIELRSAA